MKYCPSCRKDLADAEFYSGKKGLSAYCKKCTAEWGKRRRSIDPIARNAYERDSQLRTKYGISSAQYDQKLQEQGGVCAICGNLEITRHTRGKAGTIRLAVDHDHKTGKVRGLICTRCNVALGAIEDNVERLHRLISYLRQYNG